MRATVVVENEYAELGEQLDVVGWVHYLSQLYAVVRDDEGHAWTVPVWTFRLEPREAAVTA